MAKFSSAAKEITMFSPETVRVATYLAKLGHEWPDADLKKIDTAFRLRRWLEGGFARADKSGQVKPAAAAPEADFSSPRYFVPVMELAQHLVFFGASAETLAAGILYSSCRAHDPKILTRELRDVEERYVNEGFSRDVADSIISQIRQALTLADLKMPHWSPEFTKKVVADKIRKNIELKNLSKQIRRIEKEKRDLHYAGASPGRIGPKTQQLERVKEKRTQAWSNLETVQYDFFVEWIGKNEKKFGGGGPALIRLCEANIKAGRLDREDPKRARQAAREYLLLHRPLALAHGWGVLARGIADRALRFLYPGIYGVLASYIHSSEKAAFGAMDPGKALAAVMEARFPHDLMSREAVNITGRAKQVHSLWDKLRQDGIDLAQEALARGISIDDLSVKNGKSQKPNRGGAMQDMQILVRELCAGRVYDLFGARMVVDTDMVKADAVRNPERYKWLDLGTPDKDIENAIVRRLFGHYTTTHVTIDGRLKDYVSNPKANGYQSLQHVLMLDLTPDTGAAGRIAPIMVELQARSKKMHQIAEYGHEAVNAAHGAYKLQAQKSRAPRKPGSEYIHVFTPEGQIFKLPKGATIYDLAFAIHSELGPRVVSAKVSSHYVSWIEAKKQAPLVVETRAPETPLVDGSYYDLNIDRERKITKGLLNYTATLVKTSFAMEMVNRRLRELDSPRRSAERAVARTDALRPEAVAAPTGVSAPPTVH